MIQRLRPSCTRAGDSEDVSGSHSDDVPANSDAAGAFETAFGHGDIVVGAFLIERFLWSLGAWETYKCRHLPSRRPLFLRTLAIHSMPLGFPSRFEHALSASGTLRKLTGFLPVLYAGMDGDVAYNATELPHHWALLDTVLAKYVEKLKNKVLYIAHDLSAQVANAHYEGIVHGNIQPLTIFLRNDTRKATTIWLDGWPWLDVAASIGPSEPWNAIYISPEQRRGLPPSAKSDVYSIGMLLYEVLAAELPYVGGDTPLSAVARKPLSLPKGSEFPLPLTALVNRCISIWPEERPDASELFDEIGVLREEMTMGDDFAWSLG